MNERIKIFKELDKILSFSNRKVLILLFITLLSVLPEMAYPFVYKYFIDHVLTISEINNIYYVIIGFTVIFIFKLVISYLLIYSRNKCFRRKIILLKQILLKNFLSKDFNYYKQNKPSELKLMIDTDTAAVNEFLNFQIIDYLKNIIVAFAIGSIMLYLNWMLFLGCFIFFIFSLIQTQALRKKASKSFEEAREYTSRETDKIREDIYLWKEIKSLNIENIILRKYKNGLDLISRYTYKEKIYEFISYYFGALNNFLISNFFVYIVGGLLIISNQLSISSFLVFTGFYLSFVYNIQLIISNNLKLGKNKVNINRILNELQKEKCNKHTLEKPIETDENKLELVNINFKYNNRSNSNIIEDFSYQFSEEKNYLLKGRSGIGKSTLAKLITGEYVADSGKILFNGIDFKNLVIGENTFSMVSKESKIFNTTILENLLYANGRSTQKEIEEACKNAEIYELIVKLPDKFETVIGENGVKLSGGERQRLALARLFLKKSLIYILDESTSEIASDSEYRILNRLIEMNPHSIFIVISHKDIDLIDKEIICI
ncbi:ABC transporter ATP-binding protein [Bacillus mobilis]|uniref:ABC transporter ATP-binding protein n=1 Tax=Bacillus mobilis TaxID=2026190 RepID=UPI002E2249B3|nr:ABC transporter ATP-binding protein [Bacillus mobilis]